MRGKFRTPVQLATLVLSVSLILGGCQSTAQKTESKTETKPTNTAQTNSGKFAPEKPITMMVPFSAGGGSDLLARAVEKVWSKYCPQQVLVTNKPSGAGIEGANFVAKSKPDGYTILIGYGSGNDVVSPHLQKMPYDPLKDLTAVSTLSIHSILIAVPKNSPFNSMKDVTEWAKKENKPVTAAVSTAAGSADLLIRAVSKVAGIPMTPVPHSGGNVALNTLIGGNTMIGTAVPSEAQSQLKSGTIRPIAISTPERDPVLKDVPTFKEQGINFSSYGSIKGVAVPVGASKEIVDYYADLFKKISEDEEFKKAMDGLMQPVIYKGAAESAKLFKEAYDDYGKIIKENNIKIN
ncbi:MAG: hypothetical protein K0R31_44 [Clostridiales bacterium]|jgi:tripartite-type tricarboxylate transporter receptor subunit TctC|nr:hypothetical protein [Clostridiales bacterium]